MPYSIHAVGTRGPSLRQFLRTRQRLHEGEVIESIETALSRISGSSVMGSTAHTLMDHAGRIESFYQLHQSIESLSASALTVGSVALNVRHSRTAWPATGRNVLVHVGTGCDSAHSVRTMARALNQADMAYWGIVSEIAIVISEFARSTPASRITLLNINIAM